jgi:soluble lytic murein transglycosylase-like protein
LQFNKTYELASITDVTVKEDSKVEVKEVKEVKVDESWYVSEIPLTKEQQKYVIKLCEQYKFDPFLIYAVMKQESNYNIKCESETSDFGIMQINKCNFKWLEEQLGKDLKFLTFEDNVMDGIYMLDHYRNAWKYSQAEDERKHMIYYLNSYNMGVKGYKSFVASRGGKYNREYSSDILETYKNYLNGNFE